MIDCEKIKAFLQEEIAHQKMMVVKHQLNSCGQGMAVGAHDAYANVLDFIEGREDE